MLKTKDLTIGYPTDKSATNIIQKNLNLELRPQSFTALLGINGIGKSTLIRTLIGQQKAVSGTIELKNKNLLQYPTTDLAKEISIVLTTAIPLPHLTVLEVLKISRTPYTNWKSTLTTEDNYWIEKAIHLTAIETLTNQPLTNLSDGQLQRVLVARALAQNTPIILLDEPASHLDLHHKVKLYQLLQRLTKEENKTILFSSHDIELALQFADQAIVLQENGYKQNTIEALVSNGIFDHFFPDTTLQFDRLTKRFTLAL